MEENWTGLRPSSVQMQIMINARRSYYSQFMEENSSKQSELFRESNNLLNIHADKTLPPHKNAVKLAKDVGDYFVREITAIISKLATSPQALPSADQKSDSTTALEMTTDPSFSEVALLTREHEKNSALTCNKSCDPDPLPSSILSRLAGSLMSGTMPFCIHC